MREVLYNAACSLDGFIAGPNESLDWLHWSDDAAAIMNDYWKRVDTILMGRKTWDFAAKQADNGSQGGMHTYVFSRTLTKIARKGVTLVRDDAGEFVSGLKAKAGKEICLMGGGDFATSLFAAGVVDEVACNFHPILLGAGVPMFGDAGHRVSLELSNTRQIDGGCVYSTFRVR